MRARWESGQGGHHVVGATDASGDAGERRGKGRATAAAGQTLYICAGRLSDPTSLSTPAFASVCRLCVCVSASHARLFRGLWVCVWPRGP